MLSLLVLVLVALALLLATTARAGPLTCWGANDLCYQGQINAAGDAVDMVILTKVSGWVSIAFGGNMMSAEVVMLWQDATTGAWTASRRLSTGFNTPAPAPASDPVGITLVRATTTPDANGMHTLVLTRPVARVGTAAQAQAVSPGTMAMMYAYYSGTGVSAANLPIHTDAETFTYNHADASVPLVVAPAPGAAAAGGGNATAAANGTETAGAAADVPAMVLPALPPVDANAAAGKPKLSAKARTRAVALALHGVFMALAWSILSFVGIILARFAKHRLPTLWFPLHRAVFTLVILLTITGLALVVSTTSDGVPHFHSTHGKLGLTVTILAPLQGVLGVVIDKLFNPHRSGVPLRDRAHWLAGYAMLGLGAANTVLGHLAYDTPPQWIAVNLVLGIELVLAFGFAQWRIGQVHDHPPPATSSSSPASEVEIEIGVNKGIGTPVAMPTTPRMRAGSATGGGGRQSPATIYPERGVGGDAGSVRTR
ncbi:hypothetical protein H9P43_007111 [Blastocladiella emersonii ATCC 22665]|nr:hypothetical protein H9P43_007111 [Blastocladiella emersonii ATCC 22665]